jgi:hypothetical protein
MSSSVRIRAAGAAAFAGLTGAWRGRRRTTFAVLAAGLGAGLRLAVAFPAFTLIFAFTLILGRALALPAGLRVPGDRALREGVRGRERAVEAERGIGGSPA